MTERQNQQNNPNNYTPEQKEGYLDNIVTRLSNMEMRGSSLSNKDLLGQDWQKGVKMFGLEQFPKRIQGDIILSLAYYRSDSYKDRAVRMLGYDTVEKMSPEDKETYDEIVELGQSAYADIRYNVSQNSLASRYNFETSEVFLPQKATKIAREHGVANHELAHHLYHPGSIDSESQSNAYHKIDDDPIKPAEFNNTYKEMMTSKDGRELISLYVRYGIKLHDDDETALTKEKGQELLSSWKDLTIPSAVRDKMIEKGLKPHDNQDYERAADIHGVRMLMLRDGIWNPFSGQPLTEKEIDAFHKKHPNSRIFEYWDKKKAVYFINNIASLQPYDLNSRAAVLKLESLRSQVSDNIIKELSESAPSVKTGTGSIPHPGPSSTHPVPQSDILSSMNYDEILSRQESQEQERHRGLSL